MNSSYYCDAAKVDQQVSASTRANVEQSVATPLPVTRLEGNGILAEDILKLQKNGLTTVEAVAFAPKISLLEILGFSEVKVERIIIEANRLTPLTMSAPNPHRIVETYKISTGSNALDGLLAGGVMTGYVTEIFGEFGTGKTQLCHTLAVSCQLPVEKGGAAGKCLYIDCEGTFRPERLLDVADRYGVIGTDVLNNVTYAKAKNVNEQVDILEKSFQVMRLSRYVLLIVDSATFLYRLAFPGNENIWDRQKHLAKFLKLLLRITDEFGVAVVITNQVYTNLGQSVSTAKNQIVPVGGQIMGHASAIRLHLRHGSTKFANIYDSDGAEAKYAIAKGGIVDLN